MSHRNRQQIVAMTLTECGVFYAVPRSFTLDDVKVIGDGTHAAVLRDGRMIEFNPKLPRWAKMNRRSGGTMKDVRTAINWHITRSKKDRDRAVLEFRKMHGRLTAEYFHNRISRMRREFADVI